MNPQVLLQAAKATDVPEGHSGLWFIKKVDQARERLINRDGQNHLVPPGLYTHLFRMTEDTMHVAPPGKVVMEDTPVELRTHLEFMLRARGKVLVTGLGLGCVVRGCLANPNVSKVVCIEKSKDVMKLVGPYMPVTSRLEIIRADAIEWCRVNRDRFDCAWHDLWADRENGDPHLSVMHTQLIISCLDDVDWQGAWAYNRIAKNYLKRKKVRLVG